VHSLLGALGGILGGKLYISGVAGFNTPIWDVLAPEEEREEAGERLYSAKFENYVPIRQAVPVGFARARICCWARAQIFIIKFTDMSSYSLFTHISAFFVHLGMREWMDGNGYIQMSFLFREHLCHLILNIRRALKHKIYSPRSVSLLGFVASYMKNEIKMEQSPPLCSARYLGTPQHLAVLSTSLPSSHLSFLTPSPSSQPPRPRLHTAPSSPHLALISTSTGGFGWDFVAVTRRDCRRCHHRRCCYTGPSSWWCGPWHHGGGGVALFLVVVWSFSSSSCCSPLHCFPPLLCALFSSSLRIVCSFLLLISSLFLLLVSSLFLLLISPSFSSSFPPPFRLPLPCFPPLPSHRVAPRGVTPNRWGLGVFFSS